MSKKNKKRLVLNTETLRNLQDSQLRQVIGGAVPQGLVAERLTAGGGPLAPCAAEAFDPGRQGDRGPR